jgi:hypothetical protein
MSMINEDTLKAYVERKLQEMVSPTLRTDQLRRTRVDRLEETRQWMKKAVESLPLNLKDKGWLLVEHLDRNKLMLDATGAFIPKNQRKPIEGSQIVDLMRYTLRKSSKEEEPKGFPIFLHQLKSYGIGKDMISPRHFNKEIKKRKKADPMEVDEATPIKAMKKGTPTSV